MSKIQELAKYLEINESDIQKEDSNDKYAEYRTPVGTYTVMTEEESDEAVIEDIESLVDDMGIEVFTPSFQERILSEYIENSDWFRECCEEDYYYYAQDIKSELNEEYNDKIYENRLVAESVEQGIIDEDDCNENGVYQGDKDLVEELSEKIVENIAEDYDGDYAQWYIDDFGDVGLRDLISRGIIHLDIEGIAEECIEMDGYGHSLASWDGKTIELDNFYAYKQNEYDERDL